MQYPLYGQCVAIANRDQPDRPSPQVATEVLLLLFGLGTIAGPLVAGQVMRAGAAQLFSFVGVLLALVVGLAVVGRPGALPLDPAGGGRPQTRMT